MPVFAEELSVQQYTHGKPTTTAQFSTIPDIRKLFLVAPTQENLAGRLQTLLRHRVPRYKKSRRHRKKKSKGYRRRRPRRRTRRKRGRRKTRRK